MDEVDNIKKSEKNKPKYFEDTFSALVKHINSLSLSALKSKMILTVDTRKNINIKKGDDEKFKRFSTNLIDKQQYDYLERWGDIVSGVHGMQDHNQSDSYLWRRSGLRMILQNTEKVYQAVKNNKSIINTTSITC